MSNTPRQALGMAGTGTINGSHSYRPLVPDPLLSQGIKSSEVAYRPPPAQAIDKPRSTRVTFMGLASDSLGAPKRFRVGGMILLS